MNVDTARFGTLPLKTEDILTFPQGMLGFSHLKRFFILDHNTPSAFRWLQSVDDPDIAFVIIDPARIVNRYNVRLNEQEHRKLHGDGCADPDDLVCAVIANVTDPSHPTVNLLAPLCICASTRRGLQTVQLNSGMSARHPIGRRKTGGRQAA